MVQLAALIWTCIDLSGAWQFVHDPPYPPYQYSSDGIDRRILTIKQTGKTILLCFPEKWGCLDGEVRGDDIGIAIMHEPQLKVVIKLNDEGKAHDPTFFRGKIAKDGRSMAGHEVMAHSPLDPAAENLAKLWKLQRLTDRASATGAKDGQQP
jgi:hypothetical protein